MSTVALAMAAWSKVGIAVVGVEDGLWTTARLAMAVGLDVGGTGDDLVVEPGAAQAPTSTAQVASASTVLVPGSRLADLASMSS